jgi:oxygen-independent coproporphyrinogen-3 oxidase
MLLYVHVPFCRRKCHYCAFHSVVPGPGQMRRYVELVEAEAALWGQRLKRPRVETLHLGGGTPSLLPPALLERLVRALRANFAFAPGLEFGVEANPESVADWTVMETLRRLGVTRLSLGVQSFDDNDLTRLGRPHTAEQAEAAVRLAQGVGFPVVSLDLMWGLPGQRLHHWLANLKKAARLGPQHISCYGLTLEPGTPLERQANETDLGLPDEGEQQRMYLQGGEFLESEGYLQYEISNFARMGLECRHNMGYWEGRPYLGLGPAAVSTLGARRWKNPEDLDAYAQAVQAATLGTDAEALDEQTRLREMVMLRLRTTRGLDLAAYRKAAGRDLAAENQAMLRALRQRDLIRLAGGHLRLTRPGMLVSDAIIANLFPDLPAEG